MAKSFEEIEKLIVSVSEDLYQCGESNWSLFEPLHKSVKELCDENESLIKELEKGSIKYFELERKYFLVQQQLRLWNA